MTIFQEVHVGLEIWCERYEDNFTRFFPFYDFYFFSFLFFRLRIGAQVWLNELYELQMK